MQFDFLNPDYTAVFAARLERLRKIRAKPESVPILKAYYKQNPAQFIEDWGVTFDPRNVERGLPSIVPFVLFPRQREWIDWVLERWQASESGLCDKARDAGVSWLAISLSCSMCLLYDGLVIGFGSRKEEYVDKLDGPKSLFFKARMFMQYIPREFRGGWDRTKNAPHMRITFPESGSVMTGEAGDNIGRGDRASIYYVDESAHIERPQLIEAALSATTNCRIDISSANGMSNPFAIKRHSWPAHRIFSFGWRQDPRKTQEWYDNLPTYLDALTIAQEVDINYSASVAGVVIPNEWVQAAIDAHIKLGITVTGKRRAALDVADEGKDLNAVAGGYGILLDFVEPFSGKGSDIYKTTERAFEICDQERYTEFAYDADGLGAGVRGDARSINEARKAAGLKEINVYPFRGSAGVLNPEGKIVTIDNDPAKDKEERLNKDYFQNLKAQAWWNLRFKFLRTYRAVVLGHPVTNPDDLISINSNIPKLQQLILELSQPTYGESGAGKMLINKQPDASKSPNMADAVMILNAPAEVQPRGFFDL